MKKAFLLLLLFSNFCFAQILNDSTVQVYGPQTVRYLFETDFIQDDTTWKHPDTTLQNFRFMTLNKLNGWKWQDLGNEATATYPITYSSPENAFTETGLNSFSDAYAPKLNQVKYFNTRSPYTELNYIQGGNGQALLGFGHSQNVNPRLNFSLFVNRNTSSKQYSGTTSEDRLADHWDYTFATNYKTKNEKYTMLANWLHFNHRQIDQGGIQPFQGTDFIEPGDLQVDFRTNYQERLKAVESRERWNNLHLYHQYKFNGLIQFFHAFDMERKKYFHRDTLIAQNNIYEIYADTVSAEKMKNYYFFRNFQNHFGFKGFYRGFKYDLGLINRIYAFQAIHNGEKGNFKTEILVGGNAAYTFKDQQTDLKITSYLGVGQNLNLFLRGRLNYHGFNLGFDLVSKPAGLIYQNFQSPVANWSNNFGNVTFTDASASYLRKKRKIGVDLRLHLGLLTNYVYFNEEQAPQQLSGEQFVGKIESELTYKGEKINMSNRLIVNLLDRADLLGMPLLSEHFNFEYMIFYAKVLNIHLGTDIYYRPKYFAKQYSTYLMNFYVQNNSEVMGYPLADVYADFRLKRVKLAFGFNFINQGIPVNAVYSTPNYLDLGRTFYLKVNWPLFD